MPSFRLDPYLWVHLAGLAAVPIWLDLCLLGLATGDPVLPISVEIALLTLLGSLPIVWMQWRKPFCIYSLVFLSLKPTALDETQRRILRLFRDPIGRLIALATPMPLIIALWQLYNIAPLASQLTPFPNRFVGFGSAAIAFLLANLFLQVPASVIKVLLASDQAFARLKPYPSEYVGRDFFLLGLRVNRILPPLTLPAAPARPSVADESFQDPVKHSANVSKSASVNSSIQQPFSEAQATPLIEQPTEILKSIQASGIELIESLEEVISAEVPATGAKEPQNELPLAAAEFRSDVESIETHEDDAQLEIGAVGSKEQVDEISLGETELTESPQKPLSDDEFTSTSGTD